MQSFPAVTDVKNHIQYAQQHQTVLYKEHRGKLVKKELMSRTKALSLYVQFIKLDEK